MEFIDNKNKTLLDDLRIEINSGSKIYITAFLILRRLFQNRLRRKSVSFIFHVSIVNAAFTVLNLN